MDSRTKQEKKLQFAEHIRKKYKILQDHSPSAIYQHLDYLYKLSIGGQTTQIKFDLIYQNIFQPSAYEEELTADIQEGFKNSNTVTLTKDEINSLRSFIGYGNFRKAKIIFLANEGGLGKKTLRENISLITRDYKRDLNSRLNQNTWKDGYWKVNKCSEEVANNTPKTPFLKLCARILLALENSNTTIESWFKKENDDKATTEKVNQYLDGNSLYSNREGISSALIDWRPLPRKNESCDLPYTNIDQQQYLDAFSFKDQSSSNEYKAWVEQRCNIIKQIVKKFQPPLILSAGAKQDKRKLFKHIWPEIQFDKISLSTNKGQKEIYVSKSKLCGGTHVILCDFLDYRTLGYDGTCELTKYISKKIQI